MQTVNTQGGNPLTTINGQTGGALNILYSFTLPANTFGPFDVLRCHGYGDIQNNTGGSINNTLYFVTGAHIAGGTTALASSATYRPLVIDATLMGDGATNLNSMDVTPNMMGSLGITGQGNTAGFTGSGYSQNGVDFTQDQVIAFKEQLGTATPAATPTVGPTAATTPITHFYEGHCYRLPGTTPTPTPTQTPTPTPTPT